MTSKITVNGYIVNGRSITIKDGQVFIDGKEVGTRDDKVINITVEGNIGHLAADVTGTISISGNVNILTTMSGDVHCVNVLGNVSTMSGNVITCGDISGDVSSMSGDIKQIPKAPS